MLNQRRNDHDGGEAAILSNQRRRVLQSTAALTTLSPFLANGFFSLPAVADDTGPLHSRGTYHHHHHHMRH